MAALANRWTPTSEPPELGVGQVHVWRANLDVAERERSALGRFLTDEERARAARFATDQLRHRFVVSRGLTRRLLGSYLKQDPQGLEFRLGEHDKPYLVGDLSAASLQFNISHSKDLALFAMTRGREIGVDLEWVRSNLDQTEIASRFFSVNEAARLRALPPEKQVHHFFELWTCKEAFVKAQGGGISFGLSRFEVVFGPEGRGAAIVEEDGGVSSWKICRLEPADGCLGALAVEAPEVQIALLDWTESV